MNNKNDEADETSDDSAPNRRSFLRTVGATAGSAAILGNVDPVTAATSGPFAALKREELSGDALDSAVDAALADEQTEAVLAELPGGSNRLDTRNAEAHRIVDTSGDNAPITQVLLPVNGRDATLGYADSEEETAVGIELEEGRYLQSVDLPEKANGAVQRKHVATDEERREILGRVEAERDLGSYDTENATINVVEETGTAYVYVPAPSEGKIQADDSAIVATVGTDSQDVTVQDGGCIATCLATSTSFWGICWSCCCQWCWNGLGCAACAGCVGITLGKCSLECA